MIEERYIAAIDPGTARIVLTVAKVAGDDIQILYYNSLPSAGIRYSAVYNPQKAAEPIKRLIADAEQALNIKIKQVVVGLPRWYVREEIGNAKVERSNPEESITKEEVEALKKIAQEDYPLPDPEAETIYCAVAQSFSSDEYFQQIESDIIGEISRNLEGNFKLFIGKKNSIKTLDKIFSSAGISIARKYFNPVVQAKAVLTSDEISGGVALLDIGAGVASVSVYQNRILRHYAAIPFGGKSITSDIKTECFISERLAENIKLAYGACIPEKLQTLGEKILQIEGEDMESYKQVPVKYLSEIITARVKEITEALLYEIQASGLSEKLRRGIVITGGCANLTNISMYINDLSGYNVRPGFPRKKFSASGCPGIIDPEATTSIGLILAAKEDGLPSCIENMRIPEPAFTFADETKPADIHEQAPVEDTTVSDNPVESAPAPAAPKGPFFKVSWNKFKEFVDGRVKDMDKEMI